MSYEVLKKYIELCQQFKKCPSFEGLMYFKMAFK